MSASLEQLKPEILWSNFFKLNAVPRASKKEERVIAFIQQFGESLKLPVYTDEVGNVIIKKPATKGYENRPVLILQSHLDMVHQKNSNTDFDFDKQGIEMYIDGDWVKAKGTTLGADNGIGVASIMALLMSDNIPHPPLEALFTIDEETGMTGALNLKGGLLNGKYLLNLDTEEDNELTIGCAGGIDVTATGAYPQISASKNNLFYEIHLSGLTGGHSGTDIYLGRANANKLMARLLESVFEKFESIQLHSVDGGGLRNAIPRECRATVLVREDQSGELVAFCADWQSTLQKEHLTTDPGLKLTAVKTNTTPPNNTCSRDFALLFIRSLRLCVNGIYRMSPDVPHLVQSSNNLARVILEEGKFTIQCLTRSSVESEKEDLALVLKTCFEALGSSVQFSGSYPGWTPMPGSVIVKLMKEIYEEMFKDTPHITACHAGLECGILGRNYPGMEMISFGPTIRGAHSPDEKVCISSVEKFWLYLCETLKRVQ